MSDIQGTVRNTCNPQAANGSWVLLKVDRGNLILKGTGSSVQSLRDSFGDDEINYALLTLRLTLQEVKDQPRNIFIHWKGPNTSAMAKVQGNQKYQQALDLLAPNHGQLEVLAKTHFDEATIAEKWGAGTGSHIID